MNITVEFIGPRLVRITRSPHVLARIFFGRAETERTAVLVTVFTGGLRWAYDGSSTPDWVEPAVVAEIDKTIRAARRPRTFTATSGVEPPS